MHHARLRTPLHSLLSLPLSLAGILTLASCSHGFQRPFDIQDEGHDLETVAILGTNDIHGALGAMELKTREADGTPIPYRAGGLPALAAYVEEMRSEFGSSLLWLDGGDEFQGSVESNMAQGEPMTQALNQAGLNAATIGNHEFDYGPSKSPGADPSDRLGALKERIAQAKFPYLSANILDRSSGGHASNDLPGLIPSKIFDTGRVKIGVLGLTTLETPKSTTGLNVRSLVFGDLQEATLRQSKALKEAGADAVVIVSHVGAKCEKGRASAASHIRTPAEPQGECGPHDELVRLLKGLPPGTVDAVVAGHTHQVIHHWIEGVPVIEGGAYGRYFNIIYLNFDLKTKRLMPNLTRIEGPVPVCPAVFQNQNDCNGERPAPKGGRGSLVPPQFHGSTIRESSSIRSLLEPVFEKSADLKKEVVATAARPIEHERFKESEIGDLVTDAMRAATGAQFAIMNSGGIRAPWEQGPVTYDAVFRTLPFDNQVTVLKLKGKEVKLMLRIAESGSRGFFSTSGVHLKLVPMDEEAKGTDLDGNGKIDAWEVERMLSVELENGDPIEDDKEYRLATLDFLINGGDDLGWFMAKLPPERQEPPVGLVREVVIQHLKKVFAQNGPLNSADHPIIDPANPRFKFEKTKGKGGGKRRRHRKHK